MTIERIFEALLKLVQSLDEEESRAVREGLDEETLAIFDLLKKKDLGAVDIKRILMEWFPMWAGIQINEKDNLVLA